MITVKHLPVKCLMRGEKHYFFGYFDKFAWNESMTRHLANEVSFTARQPVAGETANLGFIEHGKFVKFADTRAWCWQQGCMLQWLRDDPDSVIFNDCEDGRFFARILNLETGKERRICRPVYCLSPDGRHALSLNFSRLDRERPGYGYPGGIDPNLHVPVPDNEGVWLVDLMENTAKLVVSVAQVTKAFPHPTMNPALPGWFNHMLFSADGKRFGFFHRWRVLQKDGTPWHLTHMFTANPDGTDLWPLNLEDMSSHYFWTDPVHIINYSNRFKGGWQYYYYTDRAPGEPECIARDVFPLDGHCTSSSDNRWMLTDSYPQEDDCRRLYLYNLAEKHAYEIGRFYADPKYSEPTRCDLHPRWARDGRSVTIDSIHEGSRGIYSVDVSGLIDGTVK